MTKIRQNVRMGMLTALAVTTIANLALAADQHLTLRLEDGLSAGSHALPVTIVVPVTAGKGGAGAALAPFHAYGPHTIDGSGLQVAGDRITGTLSGKTRTGSALPPKNWRAVEAALRWAAGGAFRFAVRAPRSVAAEFREGPTPADRVVHLVNCAEQPVGGPIVVEMADEGRRWRLRLDSPDPLPKQTPRVNHRGGRVIFTVPGLRQYTACIVRPIP